MYHSTNDFISILDMQIWVLYRILPRFSWYSFFHKFNQDRLYENVIFQNTKISKSRIVPIQKSWVVAAALPRPHDMIS